MNIGITGHTNIEKCHNINDENTFVYDLNAFYYTYNEIEKGLFKFLKNKKNVTLVSGMARGVDEIFALIAIKHGFKLILCIPNSIEWYKDKIVNGLKIQALNFDEILKYKNIINIIETKENYNKGNYGYFLSRNQEIVNQSDFVLSYKKYESNGTNDCIERAIKSNKYLFNI